MEEEEEVVWEEVEEMGDETEGEERGGPSGRGGRVLS